MFGRRKDEDPFAALKHGGVYHGASPTVAPTLPADTPITPATTRPAAPTHPRAGTTPQRLRRRRRRGSSALTLLVTLGVFGVIAVVGLLIGSRAQQRVGSSRRPTPDFGTATFAGPAQPPPVSQFPQSVPASYLTAAGLTAGLHKLAALAHGGAVDNVRIDASSISAIATQPARLIYLTPARATATASPAAAAGEHPIPLAAIHASVVLRLIAELQRQFNVPPRRIDYIVAFWFPGLMPEWELFLTGPAHPAYQATLAARIYTQSVAESPRRPAAAAARDTAATARRNRLSGGNDRRRRG
jgi:hypothetical protein